MAAPVIDSIAVAYPAGQTSLAPGETATLTVAAHDPDGQTLSVTVTVTDAAGNVSTPGAASVTISDPLTYAATAPAGTITGGGASNVFQYKA
jgi:hypothetical protein